MSLRKADRTAYVRSPASDFQSQRKKLLLRGDTVRSMQAMFYGTLLTKAIINASITHVARDDTRSSFQAI